MVEGVVVVILVERVMLVVMVSLVVVVAVMVFVAVVPAQREHWRPGVPFRF